MLIKLYLILTSFSTPEGSRSYYVTQIVYKIVNLFISFLAQKSNVTNISLKLFQKVSIAQMK